MLSMHKRWLGAVVVGVVAAQLVPERWDHWVYVIGGGLLALFGAARARSAARRLGFIAAGTGIAMLGLGHLLNLSSSVELLAGGGLIAIGLVLLARGDDRTSLAAR